ncbi:MAG: hypothetical protein KDA91_05575 [Planctomycetaceae bacterium]|nr:hypothetical protein [Planctomycetaceae bacterium]
MTSPLSEFDNDIVDVSVQKRRNEVTFVCWDGGLGVSPSIISALQCLWDSSIYSGVVFRIPQGHVPQPPTLPATVRLTGRIPSSRRCLEFVYKAVGFRKPNHDRMLVQRALIRSWYTFGRCRRLVIACYNFITGIADYLQLTWLTLGHILKNHTSVLVPADPPALVITCLITRILRRPFIYWSLELYFMNEASSFTERWLRRLERWASRRAAAILIQDTCRAQLLVQENGVNPERILIVPNSPMGPATSPSGTFLHDRLNLSHDRKIVCQIGGITPMMCSVELADAGRFLPDGVALVLHSSAYRSRDEPYIKEILATAAPNTVLSLEPVSLDELPRVASSCFIGLAFYRKDLGPNFDNIAGASGKLAYYLQSGVPVICIDLPGLKSVVDEFKCGVCVGRAEQIGDAYIQICRDYERYSSNARICFDSMFDFRTHFRHVTQQIREFVADKSAI